MGKPLLRPRRAKGEHLKVLWAWDPENQLQREEVSEWTSLGLEHSIQS